ncbi:MAG TPA: response regulator transcription factor [Sphingomicrobium sp.]|jgi:DNA-binding response OmpR family regulator
MARIIIVDDDEIIAEIASEALSEAGHMVSAIYDGANAMEAIAGSDPDLIILDYNLPGKTGMQLLREVRMLPHANETPVMMLTARGGRLLKIRAEETGADDYIVKPFDPIDLVARVDALLLGSLIVRQVSMASQDGADTL